MIICVSLGGSKIQIGALTNEDEFFASESISWRKEQIFKDCYNDKTSDKFCLALIKIIDQFIKQKNASIKDVKTIGFPFPGPCKNKLWYSNNLTIVFQKGVNIENAISKKIKEYYGLNSINFPIRVIFDAQCDTAGELYHPNGCLKNIGSEGATVLNLATGIAAGFIVNQSILISTKSFQTNIHHSYDSGAGQLGRHLWFYPEEEKWKYHYRPEGKTPNIQNNADRLTDRLSGPSIAARLISFLHTKNNLSLLKKEINFTISEKSIEEIILERHGSSTKASIIMRNQTETLSKEILLWLDEKYKNKQTFIDEFISIIAKELAEAIYTWAKADGWSNVSRSLVLTGGVGINFLKSMDVDPERSFLNILNKYLPEIKITRSTIDDAVHREIYIFKKSVNLI